MLKIDGLSQNSRVRQIHQNDTVQLLFKVFEKPVKGRSREPEYVYALFTPLLGT